MGSTFQITDSSIWWNIGLHKPKYMTKKVPKYSFKYYEEDSHPIKFDDNFVLLFAKLVYGISRERDWQKNVLKPSDSNKDGVEILEIREAPNIRAMPTVSL